jgi:hypothetical protein
MAAGECMEIASDTGLHTDIATHQQKTTRTTTLATIHQGVSNDEGT